MRTARTLGPRLFRNQAVVPASASPDADRPRVRRLGVRPGRTDGRGALVIGEIGVRERGHPRAARDLGAEQ